MEEQRDGRSDERSGDRRTEGRTEKRKEKRLISSTSKSGQAPLLKSVAAAVVVGDDDDDFGVEMQSTTEQLRMQLGKRLKEQLRIRPRSSSQLRVRKMTW